MMSDQQIRILHIIGIMNRGGAETMIMNLYRYINRDRIQFDFVENSAEPGAFDNEVHSLGGRIYHCPHYNVKNHFTYKKWWEEFLKEHHSEYAAVHGHLGSTAAIYLRIAKKYGMYTIAHSHNTSGYGMRDLIYQIYAYPTRFVADYFFGCSFDAGVSRYGMKICSDKGKFSVLNNAINTSNFKFNSDVRQSVRRQYGIDDKLVLGHIGRFSKQKNHDFLIDIFAQVRKKNPSTVLILIGEGELCKQVQEKVNRLNLQNSVLFMGVQENVSPYYQAMDIFLLPSLYEGLGIVAVEAQTTGLRCIISDRVSKECIVTDNQVSICSLTDSAKVWADRILEQVNYMRSDSSEQVAANGYDIKEASDWLTQFYLEKTQRVKK